MPRTKDRRLESPAEFNLLWRCALYQRCRYVNVLDLVCFWPVFATFLLGYHFRLGTVQCVR